MEVAVAATTLMGASSLRPMSLGLTEVGASGLLPEPLGVAGLVASEGPDCCSFDEDAGD